MKNIKCINCESDNVFKYYILKSKPRFKCRDCETTFTYDEYYKAIGKSPFDKWVGK